MKKFKKVLVITLLFIFLGIVFGCSRQTKPLKKLIPYGKGEKFRFCDRSKGIVVPLKYDCVGPFSEGLTLVKLNGKPGFVGKNGTEYFED
ncbi:MAG: hypothetical protein COS84_01420 [Armatimonadetes bacterium CG07_land_8_20_14_0_80_40_9]|nr:MAG: hypothetical protein COS84_01420 [Armatimonadetes bacterium CG07_land_8_20_14_0_80_40_9]